MWIARATLCLASRQSGLGHLSFVRYIGSKGSVRCVCCSDPVQCPVSLPLIKLTTLLVVICSVTTPVPVACPMIHHSEMEIDMTTSESLTLLASGGAFFEGPRWHDGRWWVSDLYRKGVFTYTSEGVEEPIATLDDQPSGLGFLPDGSLLYVAQSGQVIYRRSPDGSTTIHADLSSVGDGHLNDLVVDDRGYAYAGFFGFDPFADERPKSAAVVCIKPNGKFFVAADDLWFPNGSVITEDGSTLIVGESLAGRYTAFDIAEDGSLTNRRPWAVLCEFGDTSSTASALLASTAVIPDGCCLDAEGAIWFADIKGCRAVRVAEGGEILDVIPAPEGQNIFACMLGGDDRQTLLMCVAPGMRDNDRLGDLAATLRTTRVAVPGAGRP